MEFSIKERLVLLFSLPTEGNITTLKIMRKMREDLSFSEEEHKEFKLVIENNKAPTWDYTNEAKKDIPIGEKATDIIKDVLSKLDRDQKLTVDHMALWEMFME
jgi:hypothetical protein